jgi:DNA-directed RNA polymerase specialized sigma24 family protein
MPTTFFSFNKSSDAQLIEGILLGGNEKYKHENKLYEKYQYFIKEGIKRFHLEEFEAASVYSDTIIAAINHIISGRFEQRSELKTYLFQIYSNQAVSQIRKKTTNKAASSYDTVLLGEILYPMQDDTKTVVQKIIEQEEENSLLKRMNQIGEKCKELLSMWAEGISDKEIMAALAYNSVDVVKVSRMRCIGKLREIYK